MRSTLLLLALAFSVFTDCASVYAADQTVDLSPYEVKEPALGRTGLGVGAQSKAAAAIFGLGGISEVKVAYVRKSSPACYAGLEVGDRIVAIDGTSVSSYNFKSLRRVLFDGNAGEQLSLAIIKPSDSTKEVITKSLKLEKYSSQESEHIGVCWAVDLAFPDFRTWRCDAIYDETNPRVKISSFKEKLELKKIDGNSLVVIDKKKGGKHDPIVLHAGDVIHFAVDGSYSIERKDVPGNTN